MSHWQCEELFLSRRKMGQKYVCPPGLSHCHQWKERGTMYLSRQAECISHRLTSIFLFQVCHIAVYGRRGGRWPVWWVFHSGSHIYEFAYQLHITCIWLEILKMEIFPKSCHFFSTSTAVFEHFWRWVICFEWYFWSIMSAGVTKTYFWTCHLM